MHKDFEIKHPSGIWISKSLRESDLSADVYSKKRGMGNGYVWYTLNEHPVNGKNVIFDLCFFKWAMRSIRFFLNDEIYGTSWEEWSEEKEKQRANDTILWIESIGYKPGQYSWGEIWAGLDKKEGLGGGGVKYFR